MAAVDHITRAPKQTRLGPLWLQLMIGIAIGIALGKLFPHTAISLKPLADSFVKLIRMTLAPALQAWAICER
jgi:aerobic C4-dicarboxylate transport protein